MKNNEKVVTALLTLLLFVCLYLTGQSILRTAARFTAHFIKHTAQSLARISKTAIDGICGRNLCWTFEGGTFSITADEAQEKRASIHAAHKSTWLTTRSDVLFYRNANLFSSSSEGKQRGSYPFPAVLRQITTYILFFTLYLQTML